MPTQAITDLPLYENALRHGHFRLREAAGLGHVLDLDEFTLTSEFVPVFSRAHGRDVGHRARLRTLRDGEPLHADTAAGLFSERGLTEQVQALQPGLHMHNHAARGEDGGWLMLTVPDAMVNHASLWPPLPQDLFSSDLYAPHDLILEITSEAAPPSQLANFARFHKDIGFLVALGDFGVQSADLNAIWTVAPDLVEVSTRAQLGRGAGQSRSHALDALSRMLHECGAMVALVDIDDPEDLAMGAAAEVDLFSGSLLQGPAPTLPSRTVPDPATRQLQQSLRQGLAKAAQRIAEGEIFESACEDLLSESAVMRCYLLDHNGIQLTQNLSRLGSRSDPRFWPLAQAAGASWAHREYFRAAMDHPGQVMRTGPYLSLPDGRHCITLSVAVQAADGGQLVLCADKADTTTLAQSSE